MKASVGLGLLKTRPVVLGVLCAMPFLACGRAKVEESPDTGSGGAATTSSGSGGSASTGDDASDFDIDDIADTPHDPCDCDDQDAEVTVRITSPAYMGGSRGDDGEAQVVEQTFDHPPPPDTFEPEFSCTKLKRPTIFNGENCIATTLAACTRDGECISVVQREWDGTSRVTIGDTISSSYSELVMDASAPGEGELAVGHFELPVDDGAILSVSFKACYATYGRCLR